MPKHRLQDVKRSRKTHTRVGPTGVLYTAFWTKLRLLTVQVDPDDGRIAELIVPTQPFEWKPVAQ